MIFGAAVRYGAAAAALNAPKVGNRYSLLRGANIRSCRDVGGVGPVFEVSAHCGEHDDHAGDVDLFLRR